MPSQTFDLVSQATWHGQTLYRTDPGVREVYYFRGNAPPREIRLLVVNEAMPEMRDDCIEPIDFGVDRDSETNHKLVVVDVTPSQWEKIRGHQIKLPQGWSLDDSAIIGRPS